MKAIIISDIHGDLNALNHIIDIIYKENIDKLIILGDFCSYYDDSMDIANRLNNFIGMIEAVKGNCDTSYFMSVFNKELPTYKNIQLNNYRLTITHGHLYNPYNLPNDCGEVFLSGHTHRKQLIKEQGKVFANPGSISRPRDGIASYIIMDNNSLTLYDMDDNIINSLKL